MGTESRVEAGLNSVYARCTPTFPMMEHTANPYTYETIETTQTIATTIERLTSNGIEQVALVSISLHFEDAYPLEQAERSTAYLMNSLRSLVRKTDVVFLLDHTMYFLLLGANEQGGQIVQTRLWDALLWRIHNSTNGEMVRPRSMTIGHSAYPTPCIDFEEFIEAASKVSLRFDLQPERPTRKSVSGAKLQRGARQFRPSQPETTDEELPALARKLGIPYLSLLPRKLPERLQQLVNPKLAHELHCYPLGRERNMLTVAMSNPQDRSALDRLQQETGLLIFPVLTHPQELQIALEQLV